MCFLHHKNFFLLFICVIAVSKTIFRKPRRYTSFPEQPNNIPDPTAAYVGPEGGGQETNVYSHDMYNTEHPNYSSSKYMSHCFIDFESFNSYYLFFIYIGVQNQRVKSGPSFTG